MKTLVKKLILVAVASSLSACVAKSELERKDGLNPNERAVKAELDAITSLNTKRVSVVNEPYVSPNLKARETGRWLESIRVNLSEPREPIPVSQLMRMLRTTSGINIASQLPLGTYSYSGMGLKNVDGRTALNILLGSVGLDYEVNDEHRYVTVVPVSSKSWQLNVVARISEYGSSSSSGGAGASTASGGAAASAAGGGGISGIAASTAQNTSDSKSSVRINEDLWSSLKAELEARLTYLVPVGGIKADVVTKNEAAAPVAPDAVAADVGGELFREVKVGRFSLNPVTGNITVQAPKAVLAKLDDYLSIVMATHNTRLEFEGRLLLVSRNVTEGRGIDLQAFRAFAQGNYGLAVANNALGGVTVRAAAGGLTAITGSTIASNVLGVVSSGPNPLNVFTAFLESQGTVSTMQRPFLSTTSGVPVNESQFDRSYVNIVSESTNTSTAGSATSRSNTLTPFEFGSSLRIHPRYDASTGNIRALISLTQIIQSGTQRVDQFVTGANGAATPVSTSIPLDRKIDYNGETVLRDGDLIILGGQTVKQGTGNSSGVTGLRSIPGIRHLFGVEQDTATESVYYFALSVRTVKVDS